MKKVIIPPEHPKDNNQNYQQVDCFYYVWDRGFSLQKDKDLIYDKPDYAEYKDVDQEVDE